MLRLPAQETISMPETAPSAALHRTSRVSVCKPKYRKADALFPFVRFKSNSGEQYSKVEVFVQKITKLYESANRDLPPLCD
jgi:hypothetical protein